MAIRIRSSPARRGVLGLGTNAGPSRTISVTAAPSGRLSSKTSTPTSRDPWLHLDLQEVRVEPGQR